jgi:ATP-dependent Clp protease ATP-binding subunit ClpC
VVFERFTERARQVVVLATEEARALKHNYIGSEHILLGVLGVKETVAARVLTSLGISLESARANVVRVVGTGEEITSGQIPFTPRAKKILELALREALALGHNYIGPEHILLGLAREDEGVAMRVLLDFDVDAEKIRDAVMRLLPGPGGAPHRMQESGSSHASGVAVAAESGEFRFIVSPDRDLRELLMAAGGRALTEQRLEFGLADLLAVAEKLSDANAPNTTETENPDQPDT